MPIIQTMTFVVHAPAQLAPSLLQWRHMCVDFQIGPEKVAFFSLSCCAAFAETHANNLFNFNPAD